LTVCTYYFEGYHSLLGFPITCHIEPDWLTSWAGGNPKISRGHPSEVGVDFGNILTDQLMEHHAIPPLTM
jgi:hypothetical protein